MAKRLTTKGLAALHKVTTRTVGLWLASGCPCAGTRKGKSGGRARNLFDAGAVEAWLKGTGRWVRYTDVELPAYFDELLEGLNIEL